MVSARDSVTQANASRILAGEQSNEVEREFWTKYVMSNKDWTFTAMVTLCVCAAGGVILMIVGAYFWYSKVQRFEDDRRRLENEKLSHQVDEESGRKKLVFGTAKQA